MELFPKNTKKLYIPSFEYIFSKSDEPFNLDALKTNLKSLVVIGQPLNCIPDLYRLKCLEDLWFVECSIHNADQITHAEYLQNLHLSYNVLSKIPSLNNLQHLKVLWLPGNMIERINQDELPSSLEELNLADNKISTIGNSFQKCYNLETLNLSANPIASIFELYHLQKIKQLKHLWLSDPLYELSSITTLVNYRSFVINCLPNLKQLDTHVIKERESELTKLYFVNKKNHYKMLAMDATYNYYKRQEEEYKNEINELRKLRRNGFVLTLNEEKATGKCDEKTIILCSKLKTYLDHQIAAWEKKRFKTEEELEEHRQLRLLHIELELKYFGNIKLKMHYKNSGLLKECEKVLNSFICLHLNNTINSIVVSLVIQVMTAGNFSLKSTTMLNVINSKKISESVFVLCEPLYIQDSYEPFFKYVQQSLFFHEVDAVKYTVSQCICKADSSSFFKRNEHFYVPTDLKKKRILAMVFIDKDTIVTETVKYRDIVVRDDQFLCNPSSNDCKLHNVASNIVTYPILLVEYHYIPKEDKFIELSKEEINLIDKEPYLPLQSAKESLFCNPKTWRNLVKIVVLKLNLRSFGLTQPFLNVQELNISYNKLSSLVEICQIFPNLEILEASFNDFHLVPSNYEMHNLKHIDLSWNSLTNLRKTINWIKNSAPKTHTLNLKFNHFVDINKSSHEVYFVFNTLYNILTYNSMKFDELTDKIPKDVSTIEDLSNFPIIEQPSDLPKNQEIFKINDSTETCYGSVRNSCVTVDSEQNIICFSLLEGEQFHDLDLAYPLNNLRSFTVTKNKLLHTQFLQKMVNLKELNLSFNLLESLEEVNLNKIVKLNLSCNYITSLEFLQTAELPNLKFLDVSKNKLNNCLGIEKAKDLEEFNVSFNCISEIDRFLFLKHYRKLRIIDFRNNGIDQMDILKRYLIYHVRTLEYINGSPMTESEINDAYNAIGGVLDLDYLESVNKNKDIKELKYLNLINSSIKMVSLTATQLENLISVNLENNMIETIAELLVLENLKFLSLAGNRISKFGEARNDMTFKKLEELHLNKNSIINLEPLELHKMPKLKTLFLQDNQITSLQGIEQLATLHHLILDRNKINLITMKDVKNFVNLKELYLESNHIYKLDFLPSLKKVIRLFLKNNRIENIDTLRYLKFLTKIQEFTFSGNPISRRFESYIKVLTYLPNISYVDGFLIESFTPIEYQSLASQ